VNRFGAKLRALRKARGLTLKQLSQQLHFESHSYLSAIESGKKQPSVSLILAIATLFNVSTDDLLFDDRDPLAHASRPPITRCS
jgi:transcriptional regulator with XRE-family HTH domain